MQLQQSSNELQRALTIGSLRSLNNCSVLDYLLLAFDFTEGEIEEFKYSPLYWCCADMLHLWASKCSIKNKEVRKFFLTCMALLQFSPDLEIPYS